MELSSGYLNWSVRLSTMGILIISKFILGIAETHLENTRFNSKSFAQSSIC